MRRQRVRDEVGSALVELTWLGLLLLIPLVYVIISVVTVQRSAYGATEAARAAGRAYILAPDVETARQRAFEAASVAMDDQGVALEPSELVIECHPSPSSCLQPGSSVQVRVELQVGLPLVPVIFGKSAASISVDAAHREPFGDYREAR
jgi:Flp pilus assembly protein TadG